MTILIAKFLKEADFIASFVIVGREKGDIFKFIPQDMPVQLLRVYTIWELVTLRLIKIIRSEKPDITFCSLMYLNSRVIFASKINGCKTVVRCDNSFKSLRFDNKLLIRLSYPFADRIISQTKEMKICEFL